MREEVLEEEFSKAMGLLHFDDEILTWLTDALRHSHRDEQKLHAEAVDRLQGEYKRLQDRLDGMYIDKLDGRISIDFYDRKACEWRDEQSRILNDLERHQNANKSYLDEGVALLELASHAEQLFREQPAIEKRRLLDFVCQNSQWGGGQLTIKFRQPFDIIADGAKFAGTKEALGGGPEGLCSLKGG